MLTMLKRFVLAEIIKSSTVDLDSLVNFIKLNGVEADWWNMQLPLGRQSLARPQNRRTL